MRLKKFGVKPANALKFRRTSRPNKLISRLSTFFYGSEAEKARQIADYVIHQIPVNEQINVLEKKRLFRVRAADSVKAKNPVGVFHCAERCNLAISILNEAGVKSWLARVVYPHEKSWRFHDYVEFSSGGKVHTLGFVNYGKGIPDNAIEKFD